MLRYTETSSVAVTDPKADFGSLVNCPQNNNHSKDQFAG